MIAALYVQKGGCYFGLDDVDPWDIVHVSHRPSPSPPKNSRPQTRTARSPS